MPTAVTAPHEIDASIEALSAKADEWVALPLRRKVAHLHRLRQLVAGHAAGWARAAAAGKRLPADSPLVGEEWVTGPYATLTWLDGCADTLAAIDAGRDPLAHIDRRTTADGQVVCTVYPTDRVESLLLHRYRVEVWMQRDVTPDTLGDTVAVAHTDPSRPGSVAVVLGAGNITSIPVLDVLSKLFADLRVVALKLNPVTSYLRPILERIFAPMIADGYVRLVDGGAEQGAHLTGHELVDAVHITGSARTHDAIVFGSGDAGRRRRAADEPVLDKAVTSELGGVSPTIVVPGPWTDADLAYQAEHVATQKLHNGGFNCIAAQVLVMPDGWDRAGPFLDAVRDALADAPDRPAYYPGAADRRAAAAAHHDAPEALGVDGGRMLLRDVDADSGHYAFTEEFFAPVLSTTTLPAPSAALFLQAAVAFCNDELYGNLGANIIVHPGTARELGAGLHRAVADLRYGAVGVNAWTGVAYLTPRAPWGAAPGNTLDDVRSGIGVVHNSLLFDRAEKTVVSAPFRPFPRALAHGELHLSPRPLFFVTNRTAHVTGRRLTAYAGDGRRTRLPGIFASALRG